MRLRRMFGRLTALFVLPLLLFAGPARGLTTLICGHDGVVRDACCCPTEHADHEAPAIKVSCCCEVKTVTAASAEPRVGNDPSVHADTATPIAAAPSTGGLPPPIAARIVPRPHPAIGPPRRLLKHSFLL